MPTAAELLGELTTGLGVSTTPTGIAPTIGGADATGETWVADGSIDAAAAGGATAGAAYAAYLASLQPTPTTGIAPTIGGADAIGGTWVADLTPASITGGTGIISSPVGFSPTFAGATATEEWTDTPRIDISATGEQTITVQTTRTNRTTGYVATNVVSAPTTPRVDYGSFDYSGVTLASQLAQTRGEYAAGSSGGGVNTFNLIERTWMGYGDAILSDLVAHEETLDAGVGGQVNTSQMLTGVQNVTPELLAMIEFQSAYRKDSPKATESMLLQSDLFTDDMTSVGKMLKVQIWARELILTNIDRLVATMETYPELAVALDARRVALQKKLAKLGDDIKFLNQLMDGVEKLRDSYDIKVSLRAAKIRNQSMIKVLLCDDLKFNQSHIAKFMNTKVIRQVINDGIFITKNWSYNLFGGQWSQTYSTGNASAYDSRTHDGDPKRLNVNPNVEDRVRITDFSATSWAVVGRNQEQLGSNMFSGVTTDGILQFHSKLPANISHRVRLLLVMLSKELRMSSALGDELFVKTLATSTSQVASTSQIVDGIFGRVASNINDTASLLAEDNNNISAIARQVMSDGTVVLPFESEYVVDATDKLYVPGSEYLVDPVFGMTGKVWNTSTRTAKTAPRFDVTRIDEFAGLLTRRVDAFRYGLTNLLCFSGAPELRQATVAFQYNSLIHFALSTIRSTLGGLVSALDYEAIASEVATTAAAQNAAQSVTQTVDLATTILNALRQTTSDAATSIGQTAPVLSSNFDIRALAETGNGSQTIRYRSEKIAFWGAMLWAVGKYRVAKTYFLKWFIALGLKLQEDGVTESAFFQRLAELGSTNAAQYHQGINENGRGYASSVIYWRNKLLNYVFTTWAPQHVTVNVAGSDVAFTSDEIVLRPADQNEVIRDVLLDEAREYFASIETNNDVVDESEIWVRSLFTWTDSTYDQLMTNNAFKSSSTTQQTRANNIVMPMITTMMLELLASLFRQFCAVSFIPGQQNATNIVSIVAKVSNLADASVAFNDIMRGWMGNGFCLPSEPTIPSSVYARALMSHMNAWMAEDMTIKDIMAFFTKIRDVVNANTAWVKSKVTDKTVTDRFAAIEKSYMTQYIRGKGSVYSAEFPRLSKEQINLMIAQLIDLEAVANKRIGSTSTSMPTTLKASNVTCIGNERIDVDVQNALFSMLQSYKSVGDDNKIMVVGVPAGTSKLLKRMTRLKATGKINSYEFVDRQEDIVRLAVWKFDEQLPTLVFKPVNYLFELSRFTNQASFHATENETYDSIVERMTFYDRSRGMNAADTATFANLLASDSYKFMTKTNLRQMLRNHATDFLLGTYIELLTGMKIDEATFANKNDWNVVRALGDMGWNKKIAATYFSNVAGKEIANAEDLVASDMKFTKGSTDASTVSFMDPIVIPAEFESIETALGSGMKKSTKTRIAQDIRTMMQLFATKTTLSDGTEIYNDIVSYKPFERVFKFVVNSNGFPIDETYSGPGIVQKLEAAGSIQTNSYGFKYLKQRSQANGDAYIERYFVTIERVDNSTIGKSVPSVGSVTGTPYVQGLSARYVARKW